MARSDTPMTHIEASTVGVGLGVGELVETPSSTDWEPSADPGTVHCGG